MVILIIGFQMLRLFCVAYGIFAQGETLSFRLIRFSFAQFHQLMHGQWQRCCGSTFMRYLFICDTE